MSETGNTRRGLARSAATPVTVRLSPGAVAALDGWIAAQSEPRPSRPEAIRRILEQTLGDGEAGSIPVEELNASNDE